MRNGLLVAAQLAEWKWTQLAEWKYLPLDDNKIKNNQCH